MRINRRGITRTVLLVGRWAVKVPTLRYGWEKFLRGLLANMQERRFSGMPGLCPVLWSLPGGFLLVMRRATPLSPEAEGAWDEEEVRRLIEAGRFTVEVEPKPDSFGILDGALVAVDYGN